MRERFDAVIVGSGFGGSVMAYRLSEAGLRVCLLERGKRYPPGSFPRGPSGYHRNFWDPSEGGQGLFNVWSFKNLWAIVSSGLGGGSLIYANVLLRKDERWFTKEGFRDGAYEYWPVSYRDLESHYEEVERVLRGTPYPIEQSPYNQTEKALQLRQAARAAGFVGFHPNLAVTFGNDEKRPRPGELITEPHPNLHGADRFSCRLCGECDVGCNFGSKNTLDFNYLSEAKRHGADIRDRCEVRALTRSFTGARYSVEYVVHSPEAEGRKTDTTSLERHCVTADHVILGAGSLGSTYLLLKNAAELGIRNSTLGTRFSGNGDFLSFVSRKTDSMRDGKPRPPLNASYGPVITTAARIPDEGPDSRGRGLFVQDAGYPEWVNWVLEVINLPSTARRAYEFGSTLLRARLRGDPDADLGTELAALLGTGYRSATTMPLLGMGHDVPDGAMSLRPGRDGRQYLELRWEDTRSREYFERVRRASEDLAYELGGTFNDNLLTKLFNAAVTVHPLGGCPMGRNANEGTVNEWGEVFGCDGLYVTDGAILPGPVGANPSLTIAAISNRCADHLILRARKEEKSGRRAHSTRAVQPMNGGGS